MSSFRFWTIALVVAVGWFVLVLAIGSSNTYSDENLRAACAFRAKEIDTPLLKDFLGRSLLDPESECRKIEYEMAQHNRAVSASSSAWAMFGSAAILAISGVIFGFKRTRHDVIHEIKSHPRTEIIMGDVFKDIQGSTIINRSVLRNSLNSIETNHPQLLDAMAELTRIVANSGKTDAAELFEQVSEEASKPQPRKSVLQSCWAGLVAALPVIKESVDIFSTINDFVQGL